MSLDVVVFGGCNLDVLARAHRPIRPGVSNPGTVYVGVGGAGRNVAVNLARLRIPTALVCGVGRDPAGDGLIAETAAAGVDVRWVARTADRSNYYAAVVNAGGEAHAVSDMAAAEALTPDHVAAAASAVHRASMAILDANLSAPATRAVIDLAGSTPMCLLLTSPAKAPRLEPYLDRAALIVAGAAEVETLTGMAVSSADEALAAAAGLRARTGADVVVSMGPVGVGLAASDATEWLPSLPVAVVDVTGAGDAVAAAAVYARLHHFPATETLRLARGAGAMTVAIPGATHPALSPEALRAYA